MAQGKKLTINKFVLVFLTILSIFVLIYYFFIDFNLGWNDIETELNRTLTYAFFIVYFFALSLLMHYKSYIALYILILIIGGPMWLILYAFQTEGSLIVTIRNALTIPLFAVVAPGLTFNFMQIIKNKSKKFANNSVLGNYHIHEGLIGVILVVMATILLIIRYFVNSSTLPEEYRELILALVGILQFLLTYSGSFLVFRDFQDVIHFKFLEKKHPTQATRNVHISETFNELSPESLKFFKLASARLYPIGILLSSLGAIMIIHALDFLPLELFGLTQESVAFWGFLCIFFSGAFIGFDWYRLFARCYPLLYEEVETVKRKIKDQGY
ncbi:MAG: hypothetical protein JW891_07510 [Candidatus Lokiarchaeota archaeon]|nr:hypothetical protein [Candidatus Lokiarchaeota archaeon]